MVTVGASDDQKDDVFSTVDTGSNKINNSTKNSPVEANPWRSLSYIFFTIQFFAITLDLFVETADNAAWHYAINSIEFALALYLALYQIIRLSHIYRLGIVSSVWTKSTALLLLSALMQLFFVGVTCYWFNIDNDRATQYLEWALFCVSLVWGFVNPATYMAVEEAVDVANSRMDDDVGNTKERTSPGQAVASVFTKHFSNTPLLFVLGALFASGSAILTTYQGAVINELTKAVTSLPPNSQSEEVEAEIIKLGGTLAGVWFAANLCRFLFDITSATMFSTLEIWLRGAVFDRAIAFSAEAANSATGGIDGDPASEFVSRYTSDINGVVSLYGTLLRGVIVNVLLIVTSFVFLVLQDWRIGAVTLGFLAMGVTSGPTELAGDAAAQVQKISTEGVSLLGDALGNGLSSDAAVVKNKHTESVLVPLKSSLWRQSFFANGVDTYINLFASFLTIIVVITMVWEVYAGHIKSSQFLGTFFVFKQLQKPAMKISAVIKSAVKRSANLKRVNDVVFPSKKENSETGYDGVGDGVVDVEA